MDVSDSAALASRLAAASVLFLVGNWLVGPCPWLPFAVDLATEGNRLLAFIGFDLIMVGAGLVVALPAPLMIRAANAAGFHRASVSDSIGSLTTSSNAAGVVIGPIMSGVIYQIWGFQWMMTAFGIAALVNPFILSLTFWRIPPLPDDEAPAKLKPLAAESEAGR